MIGIFAILLAAGQDVRDEAYRQRLIAESWERRPFIFNGYSLPAEAATDAPLVRFLLRKMERDRRAAVSSALDYRALHRRKGWYFNPHILGFAWRSEGEASSLLSLSATVTFYAGEGGYNSHRAAVLLWDRARGRQVAVRRLLGRGLLHWSRRYCEIKPAAIEGLALDAQIYPTPPELRCPPVDTEALAPADSDGNGRFDSLRLLRPLGDQNSERMGADQLPFSVEDLAHLPRRYRAAFEVPAQADIRLAIEVDPQ